MQRRFFLLTVTFTCLSFPFCQAQTADPSEVVRLATLLDWQAGSAVADIGAGDGQMALVAAERVGAEGRVYATEIDPKKLEHLGDLAKQEKFHNLTAVLGAQDTTNLPRECCDSIYLRRVYHHFTEPVKIDASLYQSLKPGGLLAVIDFPPRAGLPPVEGVPANRGGHGIPEKILIDELTAAGFKVESSVKGWPHDDYCIIFRKPAP
jgi:predicted methyltransferase